MNILFSPLNKWLQRKMDEKKELKEIERQEYWEARKRARVRIARKKALDHEKRRRSYLL